MNDFNYKNEYKYLTEIMLNVTDDCNLICKYCFVEQNPHYMSLQTAKDVCDYAFNNLQEKIKINKIYQNRQCKIYFFGGEPTLCYQSIIYPLVKYCNEKYPNKFNFGITTNGTLLTKEIIDFFKINNFSILLSIDGNKTTQDYNRPCKNQSSSFDLINKNIKYLLQNFPNLRFRSTIYPDTVQYLFENYLYAESLGFSKYEAIEDNRHYWSKQNIEILQEQFSKIYYYRLLQLINHKTPMDVGRINLWFRNIIEIYSSHSTLFNIENNISVLRCGLGTTTGSIGYDGSIYGCQEQTSKNNKNIFFIGNIYNGGIDIEKHKKLLKFYYNSQIEEKQKKDECVLCKLNQLCKVNHLICPSTTIDLYNNMNTITDINCALRKIYFKNSLLTLNLLSSLNDDKINAYLYKIINGVI